MYGSIAFGFNFHFLMADAIGCLFMLTYPLKTLLNEMSVYIFCPFSNWIFFLYLLLGSVLFKKYIPDVSLLSQMSLYILSPSL